jgi:hypothetical protein
LLFPDSRGFPTQAWTQHRELRPAREAKKGHPKPWKEWTGMITLNTQVEDIVKIPGIVSYFIHHGVSPITCSGAFPQTIGRLLEIKKVADPQAFIDGLNNFIKEKAPSEEKSA